ncbi:MAG TPA: hypothetical protein VNO50_02615 [Pyrinomonadaceae bacterium]|nr:hypothetical protein [Pyrinomonadaceae bacterium]
MNKTCPRCYEGVLRGWTELTDEEREIVKRLPQSAGYESSERESSHRWCNRCWYEAVAGETHV